MNIIRLIKKSIPFELRRKYWRYLSKREKVKKANIKFSGKSTKEVFTYIYETNYWSGRESISGGGSDSEHTQVIIKELSELFNVYKINSILDLPCGDFAWMQHVKLNGINYIGADIVDELIEQNNQKFGNRSTSIKFEVLNLLTDNIPKVDLIINRDCLVHFSNNDIIKSLKKIKESGSKYLLTTSFPDHENHDIETGKWRPLNLEAEPFNFKSPKFVINEQYYDPNFNDKSLLLWEIDEIVIPELN